MPSSKCNYKITCKFRPECQINPIESRFFYIFFNSSCHLRGSTPPSSHFNRPVLEVNGFISASFPRQALKLTPVSGHPALTTPRWSAQAYTQTQRLAHMQSEIQRDGLGSSPSLLKSWLPGRRSMPAKPPGSFMRQREEKEMAEKRQIRWTSNWGGCVEVNEMNGPVSFLFVKSHGFHKTL